jgi:predicted GNAT family acetyltransferase
MTKGASISEILFIFSDSYGKRGRFYLITLACDFHFGPQQHISGIKGQRRFLMALDIKLDCADVNWQFVSETLKRVGMAYAEPFAHKKAFENSQVSVFIYREDQLIGFGRAISDGVFQAAIYDVAVIPEYQARGIGALIIKTIMDKLSSCNFILYASPGKEEFYQTLGFRKMKTGMALFLKAKQMKERGFTE